MEKSFSQIKIINVIIFKVLLNLFVIQFLSILLYLYIF